jgi:hypothetical protein
MGLDQWAYAVSKRSLGKKDVDFIISERTKLVELAYWRNHRGLLTWMVELYYKKGGKKGPKKMCCIDLRINEQDLDAFEKAIQKRKLYGYKLNCPRNGMPKGSPDHHHNNYCLEHDQEFLKKARQTISDGKAVFYHDWW